MRHCATCDCTDDGPVQPAVSSPGIRRHVLAQTAAEIARVKEARKRPKESTDE